MSNNDTPCTCDVLHPNNLPNERFILRKRKAETQTSAEETFTREAKANDEETLE